MPEGVSHDLRGEGGVEDEEARGMRSSERPVGLAHATVEGKVEGLEPVRLPSVPARGSGETVGGIEVEQDGEGGGSLAASELVGGGDKLRGQAAPTLLVGDGGVGESVAEHDLACGERGADNLVD
jgi:hypothetical protein